MPLIERGICMGAFGTIFRDISKRIAETVKDATKKVADENGWKAEDGWTEEASDEPEAPRLKPEQLSDLDKKIEAIEAIPESIKQAATIEANKATGQAADANTTDDGEEQDAEDAKRSAINPNFNADYDPSKSFMGVIDSTSGASAMPTTDSNRAYNDLFAKEGYDGDTDSENWWDKLGGWIMGSGASTNPELTQAQMDRPEVYGTSDDRDKIAFDSGAKLGEAVDRYREQGVDDGTLNETNLTSNFMTKDQALKYYDAGMYAPDGRTREDLELLPEGTVLNKRDEQMNNGFTPYVPDEETYLHMNAQNFLAAPANAAAGLRDLRGNLTDYTIDVDGQKISADNFDKDKARKWYEDELAKAQSQPRTYEVIGQDGNPIYEFDGNITGATYEDDGTIRVDFDNANPIWLNGEGYESPLAEYKYMFQTPENIRAKEVELPNYLMNDGSEVSGKNVERILNDMADRYQGGEGSDEGISYNFDAFGIPNLAKPQEMMGDLTDGNWGDIAPIMVDTIASSAPYFYKRIAFPVALSEAYLASKDLDPTQTTQGHFNGIGDIDDATREELLAKGVDPDEYEKKRRDDYVSKVIASAVMPLTEYGLGGIGGGVGGKIFGKLGEKVGPRAWLPWARSAFGAVGEGLEEIPSNLVEDVRSNGISGIYADDITDDDGNVLTDENGNALKDQNTDLMKRLRNYTDSWGEAFTLGSLLGGLFETTKIPSNIRESKWMDALRKAEKETQFDPEMNGANDVSPKIEWTNTLRKDGE